MSTSEVDMATLRDSELVLATPDDDVRGMSVVDANGHRVGEVDDLVVDGQHRRARLLVVTSGGILGLGTTQRLVPVEAVSRVDDRVHVDMALGNAHRDASRSETDQPADYDPALAEAPPYAEVYGYYGITPFWGMGYITPYFHSR
jgi:sporulation protein YlmC with PRC-barrel domain